MYTPCISEVAGNIALNCAHPIVGGYTGRAVLIPYSANPVLTQSEDNPRIIEAIAIDTSAKVVAVDNVMATPFDGSSTASNAENGRAQFLKTIACRVPQRGAAIAQDVLEPILNSSQGFLMVAEKADKVGDGSFEVIGALQPMKATADGTSRNENENGGDWTITLTCTEQWAEAVLLPEAGTYAAAKSAFEALLAKAF